MSHIRAVFVVVCSFGLLFAPALAQQPTSSQITATTLLQQSLNAQVGKTQITDVTLTGTVERIEGGSDESGSVTLKALYPGNTRMDFSFPSGSFGVVVGATSSTNSGSWHGPDGVSHAIAGHNLLGESSWFFPVFALARASEASSVTSYVGRETRDGKSVEHISVSQPNSVPLLTQLSQVDYFLDSTTLLPIAISFNTHPDNNALQDIPVEIDLSDYRTVSGIQIPFHIQKSLNRSLHLYIQLSSVSTNSGLKASDFASQ